ncbi:MAG: hypothetical protein WA705_13950 [Candidatus Ozemobacteraceae bacterium]
MTKRGMVLPMVLIFAMLLLLVALSFSKILQQARPQNTVIDERVKMEFLAQGYIELAILKYQLYPSDFYAACEAARLGFTSPLNTFVNDAALQKMNFTKASCSFALSQKMSVQIASMTLLASYEYHNDAIRIIASGSYQNNLGQLTHKDIIRIFATNRQLLKTF